MSSLQDLLTGPKPKVSALKRTRAVTIRLLDWKTLTWKAKEKSLPMLEDLHNALPVNVPSAIAIAVGCPTSISLIDALSINIGNIVNATAIGVAWVLLDAFMLPGDTPSPMRQLKTEKGQGTVSFTFPDTPIDSRQLFLAGICCMGIM